MTEAAFLQEFPRLDPFQVAAPFHVAPLKIDAAAERIASRWVPADYDIIIEGPDGLGIVYAGEKNGKVYGIAYSGTARRPTWHFRFKDMDAVRERAARLFDGLRQHRQRVADYRKTSYAPHTLKVDDIITNSWGYDQTNVDWYRIVKTTKNYVWLQPISAQVEETGFMSGPSVPAVDTSNPDPSKWGFQPSGKITKHKASGDHVSMKFGSGSKWDGRPMHCSWYA